MYMYPICSSVYQSAARTHVIIMYRSARVRVQKLRGCCVSNARQIFVRCVCVCVCVSDLCVLVSRVCIRYIRQRHGEERGKSGPCVTLWIIDVREWKIWWAEEREGNRPGIKQPVRD